MSQSSQTPSESDSPLNSTPSNPPISTTQSSTKSNAYSSLPECEDDNSVVFANFTVTFSIFKNCMLTHMKNAFLESLEEGSRKCESLLNPEDVDIQEFRRSESVTEWAVLPKCKEPHHLLTLGIEQDLLAEKELKKSLPDLLLHGSDPIRPPYQQFFPFGIGRKSRADKLRMINSDKKEEYHDVTILEFVYFLKEVLNLKVIDFLWINTKGSEYEIFDYFYKNGRLEKESITVCQINLEVHPKSVKNGVELFQNFISKLAEDEKFLLMKGRTSHEEYRLFLLNVIDPKCVNKYVL